MLIWMLWDDLFEEHSKEQVRGVVSEWSVSYFESRGERMGRLRVAVAEERVQD